MAEVSGFSAAWRTLRIPNYRNYMSGNFVSQIGMWVQRVAVQWLTWELTHSPTWLGIIAFADFFPNVVMAPLAGALADRLDRLPAIRLYVLLSACLSAGIAGLTLAGLITIEYLFILVLLNGTVLAFNYPVRLAIIHGLVGRDDLTSAISINSVGFAVARIGGPALAGFMISQWSVGPAVSFTVIADVIFIMTLYRVELAPHEGAGERRSVRQIPAEIMEGFRYVANHAGIGPLLVILVATAILARPFTDLLAGFADNVFGRGADGLAWLTAMLGVGAAAGSIVLASYQGIAGLTRKMINQVMVLCLAVIGFTLTDVFWVALCFTVAAGYSMVAIGVIEQSLMQASVDNAMRGRVLSLYTLVARGCPAIGALLMGWLASFHGLRLPVAGGAVLCLGLWLWARRRQDRMAKMLEKETG